MVLSHGPIHFAYRASQDVDQPRCSIPCLCIGNDSERLEFVDIMQQRILYYHLAYLRPTLGTKNFQRRLCKRRHGRSSSRTAPEVLQVPYHPLHHLYSIPEPSAVFGGAWSRIEMLHTPVTDPPTPSVHEVAFCGVGDMRFSTCKLDFGEFLKL